MQIDSTNRPANNLNWSSLLLLTGGRNVSLNRLNLLKERGLVENSVVKDSLTTGYPTSKKRAVYSAKLKDNDPYFNFRRKIKIRGSICQIGDSCPLLLSPRPLNAQELDLDSAVKDSPTTVAYRKKYGTNLYHLEELGV